MTIVDGLTQIHNKRYLFESSSVNHPVQAARRPLVC
jgi:hypothetical protein